MLNAYIEKLEKNQMNGCLLHSVYSGPNEYMSPINSITFLQIYGSVFDKMAESYFAAQYDIFYCIVWAR